MTRILLDQGLPRTTALHLKSNEWDVLHTGDIGLSKAKDLELLEYARLNKRIIITLDSDFHSYLAVSNAHAPSVIRVRIEGLKAREMAGLIDNVWTEIERAVKYGAMVTITEKSIRIHALPVSK